jgi:hypothetical protein
VGFAWPRRMPMGCRVTFDPGMAILAAIHGKGEPDA